MFPSPALAFIPHWDPREAFFIRQFAYLFFLLAMLFFIYELKQGKFQRHRGFRQLVWAGVFFALWNLECFIGQWFALFFQAQLIGAPGSWSQHLGMVNLADWITYFTRLDHLLLVPAFIFFYAGVRAFRQEEEVGEP